MSLLLHIERREYKYHIDEEIADSIRAAILPFCEPDPYAAGRPGGEYTIESLYLDTADLALLRANETENVDRFKVRIRTYPGTPGAPHFFEVKRRVNDVISKTRGRAPEGWRALLEGVGAPLPDRGGKEARAIERFVTLVRTYNLRPLVMVRYEREPYASTIDDYARITFDRRIRSQLVEDLSFQTDEGGWRASDTPVLARHQRSPLVLELKFTNRLPSWMMHVVQSHDLWRRSFSKYATSVYSWTLPPTGRRSTLRRFGS
ncbi:MAG: hypothetical protein AMXMBFR64_46180 [Myxococcales bacterium]